MRNQDESRPDPNLLLRALRSDPNQRKNSKRGHLKIFLGMSAGVGKTYAMLRAAHELKSEGIDVLIGIVETHGRKDTDALAEGLPTLPRRIFDYRGKSLPELDLDGLLLRKPKVALIDELAHSNVPGSRNEKRFQDVAELLLAGIDVLTTVNVQHIDSRKSVVEEFTGVRIHETVPDIFFDEADEVILIDLDPDELLKRLDAGQIYKADKKKAAKENFFSRVNLTALREMALRFTAGQVERDLLDEKELHGSKLTMRLSHKFLVAVFASPYSESLLRWTKQMAESSGQGNWIAAYVDDGSPLSDTEKGYLESNFNLVRSLGGTLVATTDLDPVNGLLRIARQNNVSQIVVGKSKRNWFGALSQLRSVTARLLRESGDLDICIVSSAQKPGAKTSKTPSYSSNPLNVNVPFEEWVWAMIGLLVTWFVGEFLEPLIGYQSVGILFLLLVFLAAVFLSRGIVFLFAAAAALTWNFFFIPPKFTFHVTEPEDAILLLMYFFVSLIMGSITNKLRTIGIRIQERDQSTTLLYRATRELSAAQNPKEVAETILKILDESLGIPSSVFLGSAASASQSRNYQGNFNIDDKEWAVATWALTSRQNAGKGTDTLGHAKGYYVPMVADGTAVGVIALCLDPTHKVSREVKVMCEALSQQAATVLQRENFRQRSVEVEILQKTQKLYSALFDSVSHELKTPLTGIEGAASALLDQVTSKSEESRRELSLIILESSRRLTRVVDHFIDMSRVESGFLKPRVEIQDLPEVFWALANDMKTELQNHTLTVLLPDQLPPVFADYGLLQGAIRNVLSNAAKYSLPGTSIEVTAASEEAGHIELTIRDFGPGLPVGNTDSVFDKFYRLEPEKIGGLGLGLAIARGFIEAQGGQLLASNAPGGGAAFTFVLRGVPQ